jgi:hypothetical protein
MAATLEELLTRVQTLSTEGVAYGVAGSTVTATVADDPFVVVELDGAARTFRFVQQKTEAPMINKRSPKFDAGGVYNAAKRGGLFDRKPSQLRVKGALAALFTENGWTKAR